MTSEQKLGEIKRLNKAIERAEKTKADAEAMKKTLEDIKTVG